MISNAIYRRNPGLLIIIIMLMAISLVAMLAWMVENKLDKGIPFNRAYIKVDVEQIASLSKDKDVKDMAGISSTHLYFKTGKPDRIFITDKDLKNGYYKDLHFETSKRMETLFYCFVDSPHIYIAAGNLPLIIKVSINSDSVEYYKFPVSKFTRAALLPNGNFAFRGIDKNNKTADQVFMAGNPALNTLCTENKISERRNDAGISTDGLLRYDKETGLLAYVFFYSSRFLIIDTMLNLVKQISMLGQLNEEQIKVEGIQNNKEVKYTNTEPKRTINQESCVAGGKLYIRSGLKSRNDDDEKLRNNMAIDVYDMRTGQYLHSFYLPYNAEEKLDCFKVNNDKIIVCYNTHIVIYKTSSNI